MSNFEINDCVYRIHPVYDLYAANENGEFINIIKKVPLKGNKKDNGYLGCSVRKYGERAKKYKVHRFVWECFNGLIPEGKQIDHINDIRDDNRLCNLQLLTPQENCKKSAKNRDYSFNAENRKNVKCVKATNIETNEVLYFSSMYAVQQHLEVVCSTVKRVCEGYYGYKTGKSKKDGQSYTFEYIKKEDLPDNYLKSANKRPRRLADEQKKINHNQSVKNWLKKEFVCPRCDKTFKNNYKYIHNKICV